jgi:hypothetical protein
LGVYGVIGLVRLAEPHAFASVMHVADYGLSAIIAAWLGAIARVLWARSTTHTHRWLIAIGSVACGGIGLMLRPDLTFLDSEHLIAYAIGVALVDPALHRRLAHWSRRLVAATEGLVLATRGSPPSRSTGRPASVAYRGPGS